MIQVADKVKDKTQIQIVASKSSKKSAPKSEEVKTAKKNETKAAPKAEAKRAPKSVPLKKVEPAKKAEKKMAQHKEVPEKKKDINKEPIPVIKAEEEVDEDYPPNPPNKTDEPEKVEEGIDNGDPIEEPKE